MSTALHCPRWTIGTNQKNQKNQMRETRETIELKEEAVEDAVATGIKARASKCPTNYTEKEGIVLVNAWESSLSMLHRQRSIREEVLAAN
jgi:hypothetical protein